MKTANSLLNIDQLLLKKKKIGRINFVGNLITSHRFHLFVSHSYHQLSCPMITMFDFGIRVAGITREMSNDLKLTRAKWVTLTVSSQVLMVPSPGTEDLYFPALVMHASCHSEVCKH